MLDMIADYQSSKREDRRSSATAPQTIADMATTRRTSGTSITSNLQSTSTAASAEVTATNNKSTMDKSVVTATASAAALTTTTMTTSTTKQQQRRQKHQVKEFNDIISCSLCHGYLVEATTIDICEHSFCRTCIVRYLELENNCPKCKPQIRYINRSNLKSDSTLRTLVYKLVPGLFQQERERQLQFWKTLNLTSDCDTLMMDEEFFYNAEPISLSLEYHPALLVSCSKADIPRVIYLQCPAGVTVHHLKRLLCYKENIDPANQRVDIDIIYEDEILPEDFSLIDVGYCYNWKRVAPMRFYYTILVQTNPPPSPVIRSIEVVTTPPDIKVLGESNQKDSANTEAKRVKKSSTDSETMMAPAAPAKTVRFLEPAKKVEKNGENNQKLTYSVFKSKSLDSKDSSHHYNNNNNNETEREKNEGSGTMKMIIARKQSPKRSSSDESVYNNTNDFKSLRSNDMRYSDYTVTSTTSGGTTTLTKKSKEDSKPVVTKCDIVVSIPQSQIQRSPNSSDESLENLSLAELKTAGKKTTSNSTSSSASKKNVPKLKIELNSLKTKITIPKPKSAEVRQEPRKVSKRKLSIDEPPVSDKVDLKTYAKNIGLKPIDMEKSVDSLEPAKPKTSPDASPMSTTSSTGSSTSNGTFSFTGNDGCSSSSSSHKKRKKKHSKEPKDSNGKRRKLHAEISSQPADESLKMKVKITGSHNHRPHKVENRKSSSSSDEVVVTTPTTTKLPPPAAAQAPIAATVNGNDQRKSPKPAPSPPSQATQSPMQLPSAANFNISSLNRTLSEESSNISNLMSRREAEVSKKSTESKSKRSPPQIMTTIHSRIPSNPQITSTTASKTPLPKPLASIQEMKLPASPPLPPSLFKTTPLTIPTITATSTKVTTAPKPARSPMNPPSIVGQSNRPPKLAPAVPKTQFAVPHPPPKSMSSSSKLCPISSIASSAHKHAAQLKRSASLDGPRPTSVLTKQQKIDQDRMIRKSAYGPMVHHQPRPVKSSSSGKTSDKPFYSSPMSSTYTHEMSKCKPVPMLMPPSSISVTKMTDSPAGKLTHSSITSQQKQPHKSYSHQNNQKPALEIMRIPSSTLSMDHKPTSSSSLSSSNKSSPPKATRPPPPPIPLVKIKKSQSQTLSVRSPALTVSTKTTSGHSQASPPGLISMRSIIPAIVASKSAATSAENAPKQPEKIDKHEKHEKHEKLEKLEKLEKHEKPSSETNGKPPKEKSSSSTSKDRRPSCKDGNIEILDLSGKQSTSPASPSIPPPGNSLEAALNKIKQNMTSSTVPDSIAAANKSPNSPDGLQNLQMLSESATNREKIAIKTLPKLNEISKVRTAQAPVRQQNASVRNIPNPSALAFRNQPTIPTPSSISSKMSPSSPPTGVVAQPEFKVPTPPSSSPSSSTNPGSPPRLKKNLNIEQVAANLNMRAAAAADRSEASSTAGSTAVTSVSSASAVSTSTLAKSAKTSVVTSSNVVSSSSSSGMVVSSRETGTIPTPPKTSFKNISSLVASSSSSSTVSAGTA